MGIYFSNSYIPRFICCNYFKAENKLIIVDLDKKNEIIIEDNHKEKIFNDIRKLSIVLTVSTFILSFISNLMFCFNIHYYISTS